MLPNNLGIFGAKMKAYMPWAYIPTLLFPFLFVLAYGALIRQVEIMSPITTHILDTSVGRPAAGVVIRLEYKEGGDGFKQVAEGQTDEDGRLGALLAVKTLKEGIYQLHFEVGAYFTRRSVVCFYPRVSVCFEVKNADEHYHVPLLINPFGYSTYRGS